MTFKVALIKQLLPTHSHTPVHVGACVPLCAGVTQAADWCMAENLSLQGPLLSPPQGRPATKRKSVIHMRFGSNSASISAAAAKFMQHVQPCNTPGNVLSLCACCASAAEHDPFHHPALICCRNKCHYMLFRLLQSRSIAPPCNTPHSDKGKAAASNVIKPAFAAH